jgi:ABC-type oligopeptide transport system substrate-binding subunit
MRTPLRRPLTLAAAVVAAAALAACSTSTAATVTGTETLSATVTGKAAAANFNNSNPSAPLAFGMATLAGPVAGTIRPFTLTGGSNKGTATWVTSAGPLTVSHQSADPASSSNAPPPATWTRKNGVCHFATTFDFGTFQQIAGALAATTWHGTYKVTASGYAPLLKGKTACGFTTTGNVITDGAVITFSASGPMTKG